MLKNKQSLIRHAICVNCSNNFFVKDSYQLYGKRSPVLLQCGHSLCEMCVRDSLKVNNKVACMICKTESVNESLCSLENLRNEFPLNVFMVGSMFLRTYKSKAGDSAIAFKTKSNLTSQKKDAVPKKEQCFECAEKPSDVSCKECNNTYCNTCFEAVHKRARALQLHQKSYLVKSVITKPTVKYCSIHKEQKVEFHCDSCAESICSYCALCSHNGHQVVHKQTENEKKLEVLKEKSEKASDLCKRYQYFRKKASIAAKQLDSRDDTLASAEKSISSHFDHLHALLQLKEAKFLDELQKCRTHVNDTRQEVIKDLDSVIEEIQDTINESDEVKKSENLAWVNVDDVIEKFDKLFSKSAYVAIKEPDYDIRNNEEQVEIFSVTNKTVFDIINDHCEIKVPILASYNLISECDVPEDYVIEEIPVEEEPPVIVPKEIVKKPSSIASNTSQTSSISSKANLNLLANSIGFKNVKKRPSSSKRDSISSDGDSISFINKKCTDDIRNSAKVYSANSGLDPGAMETVKISHFMNPSDFYVHRKGSDVELSNMSLECSKMKLNMKKHPSEVNAGCVYLVQYENDRKWYRGRVLKVENLERILIQYLDYGNTEYVSIQSLRGLPPIFSLIQPMALHCKLYDCYPNSGPEWSTEAIKLMASIISGNTLTMHVMRIDEINNKLEVDLTKFDVDSRLSVRDALIFHELASFVVTNSISTEENRLTKKGGYFFSSNDFKEGQIFDVIVTHVISPSNFFLQIMNRNHSFLKNISRQLNELYRRHTDSNYPGIVYSPTVGLPVAVFDVNGTWHRGQVTGLPGNRQVEVYFVDTGETKILPWKNLRVLQNKFLRMSAQAIRCSLSDVIPCSKAKSWSKSSIKAFQDFVNKKKLKATIVAISLESLKVALYECSDLVDTCLNALFVQSGYAESVGITSTLAEFPKYNEIKSSIGPSRKYHEQPSKFVKKDMVTTKRQDSVSSVYSGSSNAEQTFIKDEGTGNIRYAVTVKKMFNPGNFYVAFHVENEQIKKLFEDMNMDYSSSKPNQCIEWEIGKLCAVFRKEDDQWYRGIIEEIVNDDKIKVFLKDIALTVVTSKSSLAELKEEFRLIRDGTFKCRLAGVVAAGGQNSWPGIATDVFQEQIDEAENNIYLSQKGELNPVDKSIPAELWVKRTIVGGPLDPSKEEWCSINRFLIDQGFALPDKSDPPAPATSAFQDFSEKSTCNSLKLYDTEINVSEWMKKSEMLSEKPDVRTQKTYATKSSRTPEPEPEQMHDSKIPKDWIPAAPFNDLSFVGYPTYVDQSCNIYIQDITSTNTLDIIQRALLSRFKDSKPMAHDLYWFPNQLCIAQYHVDKLWYRAKVIEVNSDNTVTVEMVDYGNVEVCKAAELRKNIYMHTIPLQCHKCSFKQLQPISEDGKWPTAVLDFIHGTIVEKFCQVQLDGSTDNYNVLSIKCPGGLDLCEILLSMNYARYILDETKDDEDDSDSVIIEDEIHVQNSTPTRSLSPPIASNLENEQLSTLKSVVNRLPTSDENCSDMNISWYDLMLRDERKGTNAAYNVIEIPENITEFLAEITSILSPTSVMAQIYHENNNCLANIKKQFINLHKLLQELAQHQPVLSNIAIGAPCICQYSFDKNWYRGVITDVFPDNTVKVKYVDFGNVEIVPKESVRETKEEWMEIPVQGLQCSFWGVKISDTSKLKECFELLDENICMSPLLIKIKDRTPELKVQLFKDGSSVLAYQKLIDFNVYEKTDEDKEQTD